MQPSDNTRCYSLTVENTLSPIASDADTSSDSDFSASYICSDEEDQDAYSDCNSRTEEALLPDVHVQTQVQQSQLLPFPNLSSSWYKRQYELATKNTSRQSSMESSTETCDGNDNFLLINRCKIQGSLEDNLERLTAQVQNESNREKRRHLEAMLEVGAFILSKGPVVRTQDAGLVYMQYKELTVKKTSMEYYELFCKYMNIVQVYMFGVAYVMENVKGIGSAICALSNHIDEDVVIKKVVQERLQKTFSASLKYMDTHRDRQVLKGLITELTNISFVAKLQGIKSRKGTRNASRSLLPNLSRYVIIQQTSQVVRNDMTNQQQYQLTERIISNRKLKEI